MKGIKRTISNIDTGSLAVLNVVRIEGSNVDPAVYLAPAVLSLPRNHSTFNELHKAIQGNAYHLNIITQLPVLHRSCNCNPQSCRQSQPPLSPSRSPRPSRPRLPLPPIVLLPRAGSSRVAIPVSTMPRIRSSSSLSRYVYNPLLVQILQYPAVVRCFENLPPHEFDGL